MNEEKDLFSGLNPEEAAAPEEIVEEAESLPCEDGAENDGCTCTEEVCEGEETKKKCCCNWKKILLIAGAVTAALAAAFGIFCLIRKLKREKDQSKIAEIIGILKKIC